MYSSFSFTIKNHVHLLSLFLYGVLANKVNSLLSRFDFGHKHSAMHSELHPIVLYLWAQWHFLELIENIRKITIVNYTGELPALSLLLIFQLGYLGVLKNNVAFSTQ